MLEISIGIHNTIRIAIPKLSPNTNGEFNHEVQHGLKIE